MAPAALRRKNADVETPYDPAPADAVSSLRPPADPALDEEQQDPLLAAALHEIDHLRIALERRTVIGEATGILMERYRLGPDAAMDVLRRLSQDGNRKLHDLAVELVQTSSLPVRTTVAPEPPAADLPTPTPRDPR